MSTVTPLRAETLEESSERRLLFCLYGRSLRLARCNNRGGEGQEGPGNVLFAFVCVRHGGWLGIRIARQYTKYQIIQHRDNRKGIGGGSCVYGSNGSMT